MATAPAPARTGPAGSGTALTSLRVTAVLAVLVLAWQFVTAGRLVGLGPPEGLAGHSVGAVVLHVVSGLAAAAAVWYRVRGGSTALAALAVVVFLVGLLQAWSGDHAPLTVHVPLAILTVTSTVWLAAAAIATRR